MSPYDLAQLKRLGLPVLFIAVIGFTGLRSESVPNRAARDCLKEASETLGEELRAHAAALQTFKEAAGEARTLEQKRALSAEIAANDRHTARAALAYDEAQVTCREGQR